MFCPNCGNNCGDANFCSECGQDLRKALSGNVLLETDSEIAKAGTSVVEDLPNPPIGRYYNHDHDYAELSDSAITICRKPLFTKPTNRTIPYSQIKGVSFVEAGKIKSGGFLSIQDYSSDSRLQSNFSEALNDELSVVFSWKQNDSFLKIYNFLKSYAERAFKNHQSEKWPSAGELQSDNKCETVKEHVSAQSGTSSPETFDTDKLAWYPGKKKEERKTKIAELEKSGQVYCPKCLSTSISANQKGFGFARGAIGAAVGLDVGLIAGGIGSKKVICTCLKCGYQWKAGKR